MRVCQFRHFGLGRQRVKHPLFRSILSLQKQLACSNSLSTVKKIEDFTTEVTEDTEFENARFETKDMEFDGNES